ncbi:MAG: hypothetical protein HC913_07640 [Microscillaceae bacterium]|nr:hypothetical protein [Microscillaceae bacterium]
MKKYWFNIRYGIRDYFGFSQKESNGFLVLAGLMGLSLFLPLLFTAFVPLARLSPASVRQLDKILASLPPTESLAAQVAKPAEALFAFDPNQVGEVELTQLGFSASLRRSFLRYREKAGGFKRKTQIEKLYGMTPAFYEQIAPYIVLAEASRSTKKYPPRQTKKYPETRDKDKKYEPKLGAAKPKPAPLAPFDINRADTTQLILVRGIGPAYARRIVNYREKLGGFAQIEQVREVYGLSPEAIEALLPYVKLETGIYRSIPVNTADEAILAAHPYLSRNQARAIVNYRQQHGPFGGAEDLAKVKILDAKTLARFLPYCFF